MLNSPMNIVEDIPLVLREVPPFSGEFIGGELQICTCFPETPTNPIVTKSGIHVQQRPLPVFLRRYPNKACKKRIYTCVNKSLLISHNFYTGVYHCITVYNYNATIDLNCLANESVWMCCSPPVRWGLLDFMSAVPSPPPPPPSPLDLNCIR